MLQETKRPSKEMQVTIARQLCLDPSTVSNFFMNARRRSIDKWKEDLPHGLSIDDLEDEDLEEMEETDDYCNSPTSPQSTEEIIRHHSINNQQVNTVTGTTVLSTLSGHNATTISMQAQTQNHEHWYTLTHEQIYTFHINLLVNTHTCMGRVH